MAVEINDVTDKTIHKKKPKPPNNQKRTTKRTSHCGMNPPYNLHVKKPKHTKYISKKRWRGEFG